MRSAGWRRKLRCCRLKLLRSQCRRKTCSIMRQYLPCPRIRSPSSLELSRPPRISRRRSNTRSAFVGSRWRRRCSQAGDITIWARRRMSDRPGCFMRRETHEKTPPEVKRFHGKLYSPRRGGSHSNRNCCDVYFIKWRKPERHYFGCRRARTRSAD